MTGRLDKCCIVRVDTIGKVVSHVVRVAVHCKFNSRSIARGQILEEDIKGFEICSSSDKGSDDGLILIVPLSMSYFSEDVRDGAGTIGV
ncbi:hypothetical protein [Absidia glauca]|uniref:Uncharacterized protein n=1 Tax=Absidia glauca TaxID=4829 RepID=A0A163IR93_ABSGL|nr:hypothetical protein [Absidia glauca]